MSRSGCLTVMVAVFLMVIFWWGLVGGCVMLAAAAPSVPDAELFFCICMTLSVLLILYAIFRRR